MANVANYAELFKNDLDQKYKRESVTSGIAGVNLSFIGANTVKLPTISVPGYKTHVRTGGWNRQDVTNTWQPYKLEHDRDVEFFVDFEDVDETNQVLSAGKITDEFETDQGIPEYDKYTMSTILSRVDGSTDAVATKTFTALNETDLSALVNGVLTKFMEMEDNNVPVSGLQLRGKTTIISFLKGLMKSTVSVQGVDTIVLEQLKGYLADVTLTAVPSDRLFASYDYTDGAVGVKTTGSKKIQLMFTHPKAIARPLKRTKIYLKGEGTDGDEGDGYTYRNRKYFDVFVLKNKADAVDFFLETLA